MGWFEHFLWDVKLSAFFLLLLTCPPFSALVCHCPAFSALNCHYPILSTFFRLCPPFFLFLLLFPLIIFCCSSPSLFTFNCLCPLLSTFFVFPLCPARSAFFRPCRSLSIAFTFCLIFSFSCLRQSSFSLLLPVYFHP